jgi:hypothetical protein
VTLRPAIKSRENRPVDCDLALPKFARRATFVDSAADGLR